MDVDEKLSSKDLTLKEVEAEVCERYERYVLCRTGSKFFADGWQVYKEVKYMDGFVMYKHGDFCVDERNIIKKFPLESVKVDWVEVERKHRPTFVEKVKRLFGICYPETGFVRPERECIVLVDYGGFIEVAEVKPKGGGSCVWVTELCTYMMPLRWAYIPDGILKG